eukprot:10833257-Lingulodinium_polyedra.AAC.1
MRWARVSGHLRQRGHWSEPAHLHATVSTTVPPARTVRKAPAASAGSLPDLRNRLVAYSSTPPSDVLESRPASSE